MLKLKSNQKPSEERHQRIKKSPNYRNGRFHNLEGVYDLSDYTSIIRMLKEMFFNKTKRREPTCVLPSIKTDLMSLNPNEDIIIWFGHSSWFIQLNGKRFLIDPVLSGSASKIKFFNRSYKGSDIYKVSDIPDIDYLLISHDHYDHLDYEAVSELKPKIKHLITGLGVGAYFECWDFDKNIIIEKDWNQGIIFDNGFEITITPARHLSGRGGKKNQTLWVSFIIKTENMKIFYSGDSGYGSHFKQIGESYGPFDLAILECGQYSKYWPDSHMIPEETVQASIDLKAAKLLPSHWAKFTLSMHAWNEPIIRVTKESNRRNVNLLHPMIGEKLDLKAPKKTEAWWENIK